MRLYHVAINRRLHVIGRCKLCTGLQWPACLAPTTADRAPRRGSSEQQGRRATCRRHSRWAVEPARQSSRRQSKPPTLPRDHSVPLRFAVLRLLLRSWWLLYFPLCSSPSVATPFHYSALAPPHRFLHTSRPVGTINRVAVFSFVFTPYTIDCIALLYVFCWHFSF